MTNKAYDLKRLFSPKHIAFIGGRDAELAIERCVEFGFNGKIWPVHPKRETLGGYKCYKSLDDLPETPDAAFVAVKRDTTIEVVARLSELGVGGCVCYAAGFAEVGGDGVEAQEKIITAAGSMPLIGPNCFGFVNYMDKVALWPYLFAGDRVEHGVALISQSGNIAMNLTMNLRSVPFTHVIGAGNQAVLGVPEFIDALLEDDRVKVIALYVEGLDDVHAFAKAALRALHKGVPIVAIKVGTSELGAKQASSHTSSLVGSDGLYDTLFNRVGVIRVPTLSALLETSKMLTVCGPLHGRKITSLSCSGGEATLMADLAERFDLELPEFTKQQYNDLKKLMADYVTISNPFDYNTSIWGDFDAMRDCFAAVMSGDADVNCLVYDYPTIPFNKEVAEWDRCLDAYIDAHKTTGKPAIVITTVSELIPENQRARMIDGGVAPLQGSEEALIAIAAAAEYGAKRDAILKHNNLPKKASAKTITQEAILLDEATAKSELAAYGLTIPENTQSDLQNVAENAEELGFPVVVKALSNKLSHKTEYGAVALNLKSGEDVREAAEKIAKSVSVIPGIGDRFLIEKMVSGSIAELIIGIKRDDQFGPVLVIGAGGILVELVDDSQTLLLPVFEADITTAIQSLKSFKLLDGYRGAAKADINAIVKAVMAVVNFTLDNWDNIEELDVNPLMVGPENIGVVAADAVIKMRMQTTK